MIGRRLAHYEIVEKLGQGGMGEVYRAHDAKLDRDVALKVLPDDAARDPERHARFVREARSIAALKHPNIVTVYSVEETEGVTFLTMELVEGRSLSEIIPVDGMRLDRFFDHAIPLADAIGFAHDRGITHRDLKPGNIMVDRDGRLKVLDFGLAKVLSMGSGLETAVTVVRTHDTAAGRILGTPAYMSPEQAEGKNIDHRSDIFSLGIVLYEMATGKRPFEGDTPISTISSILKDQPRSVSELKTANPRELGRIISHCLEKDPERRFQTAKDVRNEMEGLRKEVDSGDVITTGSISRADIEASERGRGSIMRQSPRWMAAVGIILGVLIVAGWFALRRGDHAVPKTPDEPATPATASAEKKGRQMAVVLPFENLGPAEDAYFAAGVTEEITTRLASVGGLGVISRTSAENYDQKGKTMKQIGADLGVDYVLEGSVRWAKTAGNKGRVRITPQLVRVTDDTPVWTDTYDREVKDIFDVQTDIATHVVDALGVTLQANERHSLEERPTDNLEAYQLYLRSGFQGCVTGECDAETVKLLENAVALDPKFMAAWYRLSREHSFMYHINLDRTEARLARAKAALDHMEAIDANHPYTRLARGFYYYYGFRDYDRALTEFSAVVKARPNDADAVFAVSLIHRRRAEFDQALSGMQEAIALDPKNGQLLWDLADTYDATRQPELAHENYERAWELAKDPAVLSEWALSELRYGDDFDRVQKILERAPDPHASVLASAWSGLYEDQRQYAKCLEALRAMHSPYPAIQDWIATMAALCQAMQGSKTAKPALESAAQQLEATLKEQPSNYGYASVLGLVYAYLGRSDEAIRQAKLATDLVAKDAYAGPGTMESLAMVYAHAGRSEDAIELIGQLLTSKYDDPLTITELRLNPVWDPLRDNPKFKEILKRSS